MARTDDQMKFEEIYINRMQVFKDAYKVRTDFASKFKLKSEKTKGYMTMGDPTAEKKDGGPASPTGAGVAIGGLLTIDSYTGPDNSATPKRGGGSSYRKGLKGNLAGTDKWNAKIVEWAGKYNINPWFIKITMALESGGDANLTEVGGNTKYEPGRGLFQITIGAVDIPVERGRLMDPDYNMECFSKVVEGKIKDAERKGSPMTVFEISWRYNGKIENNPYPKVVEEIMVGYGQSSSQNIRPSAGGGSANTSSSSGTENLGGGPPTKSSIGIKSMFSITRDIGKSTVPEKPIEVPVAPRMNIPKIQRRGQRIVPPDLKRDGYFYSCRLDAVNRDWKNWSKLDDSFVHVKGPQSNWYPIEAQIAFTLLRERLGKDKLIVIHGFEPNAEAIPNSAHVAGMAMDIHVDNIYEAIYLADTAWHCGFRAIAIGGDNLTETSPGFVHVDIGPKGYWSYNHHDVYKGPGTFDIIGR